MKTYSIQPPDDSFWCTKQVLRLGSLVPNPVISAVKSLNKIFWAVNSPPISRKTRAVVQESPVAKRVEERGEVGASPAQEKSKEKPALQQGGLGKESRAKRKVHWHPDVVEKKEEEDVKIGAMRVGDAVKRLKEAKKSKHGELLEKELPTGTAGWNPPCPSESLLRLAEMRKKLNGKKRPLGLYGPPMQAPPKGFIKFCQPRFSFDLKARTALGIPHTVVGDETTAPKSLMVPPEKKRQAAAGSVKSRRTLNGSDKFDGKLFNQTRKRKQIEEQLEIFPKPSEYDRAKYNNVKFLAPGKEKRIKKGSQQIPDSKNHSTKEIEAIPNLVTRLFGESTSFTMEPIESACQSHGSNSFVEQGNQDNDMEIEQVPGEYPPLPVFQVGFINPNDELLQYMQKN